MHERVKVDGVIYLAIALCNIYVYFIVKLKGKVASLVYLWFKRFRSKTLNF